MVNFPFALSELFDTRWSNRTVASFETPTTVSMQKGSTEYRIGRCLTSCRKTGLSEIDILKPKRSRRHGILLTPRPSGELCQITRSDDSAVTFHHSFSGSSQSLTAPMKGVASGQIVPTRTRRERSLKTSHRLFGGSKAFPSTLSVNRSRSGLYLPAVSTSYWPPGPTEWRKGRLSLA